MSANLVSYTLDSTLETVNSAEETAGRMAAEAGFGDEDVMKISMAVREAAVNAVMHGNAYNPAKKVTLAFASTAAPRMRANSAGAAPWKEKIDCFSSPTAKMVRRPTRAPTPAVKHS